MKHCNCDTFLTGKYSKNLQFLFTSIVFFSISVQVESVASLYTFSIHWAEIQTLAGKISYPKINEIVFLLTKRNLYIFIINIQETFFAG